MWGQHKAYKLAEEIVRKEKQKKAEQHKHQKALKAAAESKGKQKSPASKRTAESVVDSTDTTSDMDSSISSDATTMGSSRHLRRSSSQNRGSGASLNSQQQHMMAVEFGTLAEQTDESHMDDRVDSENDITKGSSLKFPVDKLYGRQEELQLLQESYKQVQRSDPTTTTSTRAVLLSGYRGVGKSALMDYFLRELAWEVGYDDDHDKSKSQQPLLRMKADIPYLAVRFPEPVPHQSPQQCQRALEDHPLLAISLSLLDYYEQRQAGSSGMSRHDLKWHLSKSVGNEDAMLLSSPLSEQRGLVAIDESESVSSSMTPPSEEELHGLSTPTKSLQETMYAFHHFVKALADEQRDLGHGPLLLFWDNLHWANEASLALLSCMLQDASLENLLFVGSFSTNEQHEGNTPAIARFVDKELVDSKTPVQQVKIKGLTPVDIADLIGDTIDQTLQEMLPLAEYIFSKTMGVICHVQAALQELVDQNALYYDVISFEWQTRADLVVSDLLRDTTYLTLEECTQMALERIHALAGSSHSSRLPRVLRLASRYANPPSTNGDIVIDSFVLAQILKYENITSTTAEFQSLMQCALDHGLLLHHYHGDDKSRGGSKRQSRSDGQTCGGTNQPPTMFQFPNSGVRRAVDSDIQQGDFSDDEIVFVLNHHNDQARMVRAHHHLLQRHAEFLDPLRTEDDQPQGRFLVPNNIPDQIFWVVLRYLYTQSLQGVHVENIVNVCVAAEELGLPELQRSCQDFARERVGPQDVAFLLQQATDKGCEGLRDFFLQYMVKHFDNVSRVDEITSVEVWHDLARRLQVAWKSNPTGTR